MHWDGPQKGNCLAYWGPKLDTYNYKGKRKESGGGREEMGREEISFLEICKIREEK